jgi:hypothetical protein
MLFILLAVANCQLSTAQVNATLKADSNHIEIASPLTVKLSVKYAEGNHIVWPIYKDTLGNLDLLLAAKIDTEAIGNETLLSQKFLVSAYDSGEYYIGPRKIFFINGSGALDSIETEDLLVNVSTLDVDTAAAFKPIKPTLEVPLTWKEWIPFIAAFHLFLILITVAIWFLSKKKKKTFATGKKQKPKDPAHIWARKELKKLEVEKLWQNDNVKGYYSRLTDVMRMYLEYRYNYYALESTTEEINVEVDKTGISAEGKQLLMEILQSGDLVKFAKMVPAPDANTKVMEQAYQLIDLTKPQEIKDKKK